MQMKEFNLQTGEVTFREMTAEEEASYLFTAQEAEENKRRSLVVSACALRLALLNAGKLNAVEAAIAVANKRLYLMWEYRTNVRRDSELITALMAALELSDQEMDTIFTSALSL